MRHFLQRLALYALCLCPPPALAQKGPPAPLRPPAEAAPAPSSAPVSDHAAFSLQGRISVRREETAYHGNLAWLHSAARDEFMLTSPLGQAMAELKRDAAGATLLGADGKHYQAESLDALAERLFGAPLPISSLPEWLRGIAPDARERDDAGRPRRLLKDGWSVEWLRYGEDGRPRLITVEGMGLAVRLTIDDWEEGELLERAK